MLTFKGTDKDMKCYGGFQYEIGKEYTDDGAIRCGDNGFHSVEEPLDVFTYFPPIDGNRFFACEAEGTIDKSDDDTKIASSELTIKTDIGILGLIKAQIEYIFKSSKKKVATKGRESAFTQGDMAHSATQGNMAHSATQGYMAHSATQGYMAHSVTQGDFSYSEVHGEHAIASALGIEGRVMGGKIGDLLTLYQWVSIDNKWAPISGITVRVDGEKIKPNVWYKLVDGEFVEADD